MQKFVVLSLVIQVSSVVNCTCGVDNDNYGGYFTVNNHSYYCSNCIGYCNNDCFRCCTCCCGNGDVLSHNITFDMTTSSCPRDTTITPQQPRI